MISAAPVHAMIQIKLKRAADNESARRRQADRCCVAAQTAAGASRRHRVAQAARTRLGT